MFSVFRSLVSHQFVDQVHQQVRGWNTPKVKSADLTRVSDPQLVTPKSDRDSRRACAPVLYPPSLPAHFVAPPFFQENTA